MSSIVERQLRSEGDERPKCNISKRHVNKPKNVPVSAFFYKVVALDEMPIVVPLTRPVTINPNIRTTNGYCTLTYNPEGSPKRVKGKPYTVGQDLLACRICVSGPAHFKKLCERIPELKWLRKWSFLDDGLWAVAKKHPGIAFGFNIKWVEYAEYIEKKAEEMGIDIDHKPYVCYITKKEKLDEMRENFVMNPKRTKEDIKDILDEVDKEEGIK